jgi:hypothetical protein
MFNLFKKTNKNQETIEDEFFGKLSFFEASEYEPSYLSGTKEFRPLNSEVEYQIYNDTKTVKKEQREWVIEIEKKFDDLKMEIETFINSEFAKMNDNREKINLEKDLNIGLITIPKNLNSVVEWSLTYRVEKDFAFYTIEFRNWKPYWFSISA